MGSPYRNSRPPSPDRIPLTPRSSTDSLPPSTTPSSSSDTQHPQQKQLPTKLIRLNTNDSSYSDSEEEYRDGEPRLSLYDASWSEEPSSSNGGGGGGGERRSSFDRQRDRRRRNRRIYGGGRHRHSPGDQESEDEDDGGGGDEDMGVGEVAGLITAGTLSPLPLLVPYACFTLTPALFVPLLALSGILAWASAVALGVQGRYVGARSYPGLASAVFPHRFKLHLLGEFLASSFVLGGSIVRTTLGVVAGAEVVVDLVVPERRRRDWERTVAVGVISLIWVSYSSLSLPLMISIYSPRFRNIARRPLDSTTTTSTSRPIQPILESNSPPLLSTRLDLFPLTPTSPPLDFPSPLALARFTSQTPLDRTSPPPFLFLRIRFLATRITHPRYPPKTSQSRFLFLPQLTSIHSPDFFRPIPCSNRRRRCFTMACDPPHSLFTQFDKS